MSSPWEKWYIANDEWANLSQNIWNWMERRYDHAMARKVTTSFAGTGGGYGFGGGSSGGASRPKSPQTVQSWKSKADKVIQYWYEEYERKTADRMQPKFEQWIKAKYQEDKVSSADHRPPKPRS